MRDPPSRTQAVSAQYRATAFQTALDEETVPAWNPIRTQRRGCVDCFLIFSKIIMRGQTESATHYD